MRSSSLKWRAAVLAFLAVSLTDIDAQTQTPVAATFPVTIVSCPSSPSYQVPSRPATFATCEAALQYGTNLISGTCAVGTTPCVNDCPAINAGTAVNLRFDQGNGPNCTVYGGSIPTCKAGATLIFSQTDGWVCTVQPFSGGRNQGPPKRPGCPEGNPCNVAVGNKLQIDVDYEGGGPFPLKLVRYYNSIGDGSVGFGSSWTHSYSQSLGINPLKPSLISALRADGNVLPFKLDPVTSNYVSDANVSERLARVGNEWQLTNVQDEIETYNDAGRLTSIKNRAGLVQTLSYDAQGRLGTVSDPFSRTMTFTFNGLGLIQTITLPGAPSALALNYEYSTVKGTDNNYYTNLTKVIYPDTKFRTFIYDDPAFPTGMTGIFDELGVRYSTYAYTNKLVTLSTLAGGAGKVEIANSTASPTRSVVVTRYVDANAIPPVSFAWTYNYESILSVASFKGVQQTEPCPTCGPKAATYDPAGTGNLASVTNWDNFRTNYTFNARNLETSRTEGLTAAGVATPETRTITTAWHLDYRLVRELAEPKRFTESKYTGDAGETCTVAGALCTKAVKETTDPDGGQGLNPTFTGNDRTWKYEYFTDGQIKKIIGPRIVDKTDFEYHANVSKPSTCTTTLPTSSATGCRGQLYKIKNALDHETRITEYNAHGQPLKITDPNGLVTLLTYDARQRLTSRNVGGETTSYTYDDAGQLTRVTQPDGSFLAYGYDPAHRLIRIQDRKDAQGTLGDRIDYTLDSAGNRTKEEVRTWQGTLVQTKTREYSEINRLKKEFGAAGQRTEYEYNGQGGVTSVKDPLDRLTLSGYDPLNRLKDVVDPASGLVQYKYNGQDALIKVIDPRTLSTDYSVDGLGNLFCQVSPDTKTTYMGDSCASGANGFDASGNLLKRTDEKGQVTTFSYDALNRVKVITFGAGSKDERKSEYDYDLGTYGLGRLSSIVEKDTAGQPAVSTGFAYDQKGRVIAQTRTIAGNPSPFVTSYRYDAFGRMDRVTYPSGRTVSYFFDAMGRPSQVNYLGLPVVSGVQYHPFGPAKSWTQGNNQTYTRAVDQDGRIASYSLGATNFNVCFDAASRITDIRSAACNPLDTPVYAYDVLDRLTGATPSGSSFQYSYDATGNRVTKTVAGAAEQYIIKPTSNQIDCIAASGSSNCSSPIRSFQFDPNGSTLADGINQYSYDVRGRMSQSTTGASSTTYQVDALGQRFRKTNSQGDRVFHYDLSGKLISETTAAGAFLRELIYLGDIPVGVVQ